MTSNKKMFSKNCEDIGMQKNVRKPGKDGRDTRIQLP